MVGPSRSWGRRKFCGCQVVNDPGVVGVVHSFCNLCAVHATLSFFSAMLEKTGKVDTTLIKVRLLQHLVGKSVDSFEQEGG